jgi:UDP-N-acetylmuramate--alanine ligase
LAKEFGTAFIDADEIIITSIYSAGEKPINGVSQTLIIDSVQKITVKKLCL